MRVSYSVSSNLQISIFYRNSQFLASLYNSNTKEILPLDLLHFDIASSKRLLGMPVNLLLRFIEFNLKTLQIVYSPGLKGGGCFSSKSKVIEVNYTEDERQKLRVNQIEAMKYANDIASQISNGTFIESSIDSLMKYNPYECETP